MRQLIRFFPLFLLFSVLRLGAEAPPLKVGMELSYPPFEMTDPTGKPAGVSVDLAEALAAYLKRPLKIENLPFDGLIPSLKTGRIDLILSSMTATEERRKSIDFSEPYLQTGLCILAGADSKLKTAEDLKLPGLKLAVKKGTTGHLYVVEHLPGAKLVVLDREQACILEVVQGKVDGFIYDQMSVLKGWQQNKKTTRALLSPFRQEAWAIGIRKGNGELLQEVNDFLRRFEKEGGFEKLGGRYLKEQKKAFAELGFPFFWPGRNGEAP